MSELLPVVSVHDGQPVTTSLIVAERFGKQHKHVLEAIDGLRSQVPDSFDKPNFRPSAREVKAGLFTRKERYFELTRDAFTLLAMGFTGAEALRFKIAFLDAFNQLERELQAQQAAPALPAPAPKLYTIPYEEYVALLKDRCALLELRLVARPPRRNLSDSERAEILRLHALGWSYPNIGKAIGRGASSVETFLRTQRKRAAQAV